MLLAYFMGDASVLYFSFYTGVIFSKFLVSKALNRVLCFDDGAWLYLKGAVICGLAFYYNLDPFV